MAFQQQRSFQKPPFTVFDLQKLRLTGKQWTQEDRAAPTLMVLVHNGNPRFRIYMNDGQNKSAIPVAFDPKDFYALLDGIKEIANDTAVNKIPIKIRVSFDKGARLDKPAISVVVTIGRDTDGFVYIGIQPKGLPQAIFPFIDTTFAEWYSATGEVSPPNIVSSCYARGWARLMEEMVAGWLITHVTTDPNEKKESGQNSGGYNNSNSAGSKGKDWSASSAATDEFNDDIPF